MGQRQLQDETRIIWVLGFGASYIRDFTVVKDSNECSHGLYENIATSYQLSNKRFSFFDNEIYDTFIACSYCHCQTLILFAVAYNKYTSRLSSQASGALLKCIVGLYKNEFAVSSAVDYARGCLISDTIRTKRDDEIRHQYVTVAYKVFIVTQKHFIIEEMYFDTYLFSIMSGYLDSAYNTKHFHGRHGSFCPGAPFTTLDYLESQQG